MRIEFRCLGDLEVVRGQRVMPAGGPLQLGLLAMLLLNANNSVSADRIVDALWEDPPDTAVGQVQTRIWRLRQLLHGPATDAPRSREHPELITRSGGYALMVDPDAVDVLVFDQGVRKAAELLAADRPREAVAGLRSVLSLFRGPSFANVSAPGVVAEVAAIEERRMAALEQRIEIELNLGLHAQLIAELRELVKANPYQERLRLHLMRALHRSGRRAEAVHTYREAHRVMVEGTGLEPNRELKDLHRAILRSDDPPDPPATPVVVDGGRSWARVSRDLPGDTTALVGRSQEVADLMDFLSRPGRPVPRVVGISGVPGAGKTALAVRVAHLLTRESTDGQLFAWLGGEPEPGAVLHRFLRALGLPESEVPATLDERSALFRACMADRRAVLVLDDALSEAQVRPLLPAGAHSLTIVTSRRQLAALDGAHLLDLLPLDREDGARLLRDLLGPDRVDAEPALPERIAARAEGLPLAIRAAAARLQVRPHWSLAQYVAMLDNEVQRIDALCFADLDVRAAIASSYARLSTGAGTVFRRLGALGARYFTAEDVEQLVDVPAFLAVELVEELVEARLVHPVTTERVGRRPGTHRYGMGDLCRLVAEERAALEPDDF